MSDYLSRAVERETSAPLAVRPALPSRFDPGKFSADFTAAEAERKPGSRPPRNEGDETDREASLLRNRLAAVNALMREAASTAPPLSRTGEVMAAKSFAGFVGTPVTAFPEEANRPEPTRPDAASGDPVVRPTVESPARTAFTPRESAPMVSATSENTEPRSPRRPPLPALSPALQPVSSVSSANSRSESRRKMGVASTPSRAIHITIGRIEVRAIHPAPEPAPPRPARADSKISLEEYLRRRNGSAA